MNIKLGGAVVQLAGQLLEKEGFSGVEPLATTLQVGNTCLDSLPEDKNIKSRHIEVAPLALIETNPYKVIESTILYYFSVGQTTRNHAISEKWNFASVSDHHKSPDVTVNVKGFRNKDISEILAYIEGFIEQAEYSELPQCSQINIHLARIALNIDNADKKSDLIRELIACYSINDIELHLETMMLYKQIVLTERDRLTAKSVENLFRLALHTLFTPAISFLLRESFRPDNQGLISPYRMISLLSRLMHREYVALCEAQALSVSPLDSKLIRAFELNEKELDDDYLCIVWFLARLTGKYRVCPNSKNISELFFNAIYGATLANIMRFRLHSSMDINRFINQELKFFKDEKHRDIIRNGLSFNSNKKINGLIQDLVSNIDNTYLKSIAFFAKSFYGKPTSSRLNNISNVLAKCLEESANLGHFGQLYLDAAEIYINNGQYSQAIVCLEKLSLSCSKVKDEFCIVDRLETCYDLIENNLTKLINCHINTCRYEAAIEVIAELKNKLPYLKDDAVIEDLLSLCHQGISDREKVLQELMGDSGVEVLKKAKSKKRRKKKGEVNNNLLSKETTIAPVADKEKLVKLKGRATKEIDDAKEIDTAKTADTTRKAIPVKERLNILDILPSKDVSYVLENINKLRDACKLSEEVVYVEKMHKKFKGEKGYGRICEEAGWTYLKQSDMQRGNHQFSKTNDILEYLNKAEQFFIKAIANYTHTDVLEKITPDRLREIIKHYQQSYQPLSSYRYKQLRFMCSSFGHLYSKKAMYNHGRNSENLAQVERAFYRLKTVADPFYCSPVLTPTQPSKISLVTEEEAETMRSAIASANI